jgi:pimeloyl-ACP methyl ester carboxylesterase
MRGISTWCALAALAGTMSAQGISSELAEKWRASGNFFQWQSPQAENKGRAVQVFYTCMGDAAKPAFLMLHGFPTSSFDYHLLAEKLQPDFRICTFDFPGYGLSDKPANGYRYSLRDDAQLTWDFVTKIVPLKEFVLFSHDRGDSVSLAFLELVQAAQDPPFRITHQFLTNGNVYLPLSNLTDFQKRLLDPQTSAAVVKAVTAPVLAAGMGNTTYTPPLKPADPEVAALAYLFDYQAGVQVLPATIQYLNERKQFEVEFLQTLAKSPIPATVIWGAHDMVSPVRVADYVWETALKSRTAAGAYWLAPCGNHYVQHDQPDALARIIRMSVSGTIPNAPYNLSTDPCSPVLVARKR